MSMSGQGLGATRERLVRQLNIDAAGRPSTSSPDAAPRESPSAASAPPGVATGPRQLGHTLLFASHFSTHATWKQCAHGSCAASVSTWKSSRQIAQLAAACRAVACTSTCSLLARAREMSSSRPAPAWASTMKLQISAPFASPIESPIVNGHTPPRCTTITPAARARCAPSTFVANETPPRSMSAMRPASCSPFVTPAPSSGVATATSAARPCGKKPTAGPKLLFVACSTSAGCARASTRRATAAVGSSCSRTM
mmetsp:Transcript_21841/g.67749  ORF Transcript_21841/g.67749 Transcript_21841/m.67749 type:complete len:254 (+) Transcript_21841:383-1144(+)